MMTSSNGNIFRETGPLCGEFTGPGEFPTQRPVTRSFEVFFDLRLNKRLSKQPWGWWFETLSWSLWRHCNDSLTVSSAIDWEPTLVRHVTDFVKVYLLLNPIHIWKMPPQLYCIDISQIWIDWHCFTDSEKGQINCEKGIFSPQSRCPSIFKIAQHIRLHLYCEKGNAFFSRRLLTIMKILILNPHIWWK